MVAQSGQQVQLMQKVLTEMNLHIHHVFSDVDGVSAQAIITAILEGERDATKLAALPDRRCRASLDKIKAALLGDYREEYLFVLKQCQTRWQQLHQSIAQCDQEIGRRIATISGVTDAPLPKAPATQCRVQKNMITAMPVYEEAHRLLAVDLSALLVISGGVLLNELGTATHIRQKFRGAQAFASSLGLSPDNRSAADASSRPGPERGATGSPTSCGWPPTRSAANKDGWENLCGGSKGVWARPKASWSARTNWREFLKARSHGCASIVRGFSVLTAGFLEVIQCDRSPR